MTNPGSAGEHSLQEKFNTEKRAQAFYDNQVLDHLNPRMLEFIANQEILVIATSDAKGDCDCSLRAGEAGFVHALDEKTLVYPEYRGNGVTASLGNILENPHIGMMFIDFIKDTVGLHVNGKAAIIENNELLEREDLSPQILEDMNKKGRKPERWVLVEVEEAYMHCSKHIPFYKKAEKLIQWGTDDVKVKKGDYFMTKKVIVSQIQP
ncbi:MAG: pyridoxamine 5'-phosphate oxidase family protein [Desulfobulbaceae bacterium]|nr:pyridoxamine 5'-phosphate oxidase family protein [Desulfobulbaceae bacterium]